MGARRNEILCLRWREVDFERALIDIDSKTGRKRIPLPAPALELLSKALRLRGNPYVCFGAHRGKRLVGLQRPWGRIRSAAGLDDVRLHDLRHSHAAMGAGLGLGLPIIGKLLGHTQAATTQRYAHLVDHPVRLAAERVAGEIGAALAGRRGQVTRIPMPFQVPAGEEPAPSPTRAQRRLLELARRGPGGGRRGER